MENDKLRNKLQFSLSPYSVEYSENVKQSILFALKNNIVKEYNISTNLVEEYMNKESNVPLWVIEAACNANLENITVPAKYQYLWFCLHNTTLTRKQPTGRIFETKVNFTSCYLKVDNKIRTLVTEACTSLKIPFYKFVKLCGYAKANWLNDGTIPLLAVMKASQIRNIDAWSFLEGKELFGKTRAEGKIIIPKTTGDINLLTILIWLRTDGHLDLGSTHIEINQIDNINALCKLQKIIMNTFNTQSNFTFAKGSRGEDRLIISSSPMRQLICLRYKINPGYKTSSMLPFNFDNLSIKECQMISPAFIETEGVFLGTIQGIRKR